MPADISTMLDQLANFYAQRDVLSIEKQELIDQILTPEIKARLEEIEVEFADRIEAVDANISVLEEEVRNEVLRHGSSVKGTFLRAVWNKGRVSWDTHGMEGYAQEHPEILAFRRQGQPYVSLTKVDR
jgi:hypothetical protein